METQKTPLSIKIIYWFTNFIVGLIALVLVVMVAINILLYTDVLGEDVQLHIELPGTIDLKETGYFNLPDQKVEVELVEVSGKIHFINTPPKITRKLMPVIFIAIGFVGFLTWTFRKFIKNVKDGNIFTLKNIALLKRIAYGLVAFWLFEVIYMRIAFYYISQKLEFENLQVRSEFTDQSWVLFVALLIWVLAHIFMTGVKLKEEADLTI